MAYVITEVEKSHNLPSAAWRLRKDRGITQSKFEALRTREADNVDSRSGLKP